jgi:hypothetical protein
MYFCVKCVDEYSLSVSKIAFHDFCQSLKTLLQVAFQSEISISSIFKILFGASNTKLYFQDFIFSFNSLNFSLFQRKFDGVIGKLKIHLILASITYHKRLSIRSQVL